MMKYIIVFLTLMVTTFNTQAEAEVSAVVAKAEAAKAKAKAAKLEAENAEAEAAKAQKEVEAAKTTAAKADAKATAEEAKLEEQANAVPIEQWGLGFGLGVEQYDEPYIDQASLRGDNRIVTTEKTFKTLPSAWLTMNWNRWGIGEEKTNNKGQDVRDTRWGFFAGVKLIDSNSESFSAFALGPQVTFVLEKKVISVGLGWVTHKTRSYAEGIVAGQALPAQYDDIVYEEGTENSFMLMTSVSF